MADEQQRPEPRPIHLVQYVVLVQQGDWPEVTSFEQSLLDNAYLHGAVYDSKDGTVTFDIFNGGAVYALTANPMLPNGPHLANLVEGSARKTSRRP